MKTPTKFSGWMRDSLKDAYAGLITQDIDFIIERSDRKYLIAEEKNYKYARTGPAQAVIYKMLDDILSVDPRFLGCHKLVVDGQNLFVNELATMSLESFLLNPKRNYLNSYNQSWFDKVLYFNLKNLWDGVGTPPTKKTERERSNSRESNLSPFLDGKGISRESIDWIFVNYCSGYFITMNESATVTGDLSKHIIDELTKYSKKPTATNPKSNCLYKYLGHYSIGYNDDLSIFSINGKTVMREEAIKTFNLDDSRINSY